MAVMDHRCHGRCRVGVSLVREAAVNAFSGRLVVRTPHRRVVEEATPACFTVARETHPPTPPGVADTSPKRLLGRFGNTMIRAGGRQPRHSIQRPNDHEGVPHDRVDRNGRIHNIVAVSQIVLPGVPGCRPVVPHYP